MFNSTADSIPKKREVKESKEVRERREAKENRERNYVFFWKPNGPNGIFSQWYQAPMIIDEIKFANCEQYMMYRKAKLFKDEVNAGRCLQTSDPKVLKALGRKVTNFDEKAWTEVKHMIVLRGNLEKFTQNPELGKILSSHAGKEFAEASPADRVWGIGFTAVTALDNKEKWGENLLGKVLTEVSKMLS